MSDETKKVEDGGSAFPDTRNAINWNYQPGMSLRDYFAGMALQGYLSNPENTSSPGYSRYGLINECYLMADAMIERRKK